MKKSLFNWMTGKKSVIVVDALREFTREGINKAYIPKFLYKPPFGYPRFSNITYIRYLAQTPYVDMCIKTIVDELRSVEWDIVPCDGMEEQADEAEIEHIRNFFLNPNSNKETFEQVFIEMPVRDMLEVNSGILNKVYNMKEELVEVVARDGGTFTKNPDIHGMYTDRADIILPNRIVDDTVGQEYLNPWTEITATNAREKAAYFQYGWIAGPLPVPFGKKELIWIEGNKRTDDHYGYSPIQILQKSLQMLIYMVESDLDYYNENNIPKGIVGLEDSDAEEIEAFKEQWFEMQRTKDEFGNWRKMQHKVPVLNKVPTFTRVEFSSSEMQVIEKQKWYTKMVWASFGVTPVELGYTDESAGAANQIVQSKVFRKKAINPILRKLENGYNINIICEFGYQGTIKTKSGKQITRDKYEFKFKRFDVDEEKSKYELYKLQSESGIRTVNEIRKDEGLEEVDWGNDPPKSWQGGGSEMNFGDFGGGGYERDYNDREDDAENPDEGQEEIEEKSQKKKTSDLKTKALSADPKTNPLLMDENERPTSEKKLKEAIVYVFDRNEKEIERILKLVYGKKSLPSEEKDVNSIIKKIRSYLTVDALKGIVNEIISNNYMKGWDEAEKALDRNLLPDKNAIAFIQDYTFDNVKGINDEIMQRLRQTLQRGFMDGTPLNQMMDDVKKAFDVGDNRAEKISRTETNRAANFGRLHGYMKAGIPAKKKYVAKIDDRTSPICRRLNGQERPLDESFVDPNGEWEGMVPPAHVNCRSTFVVIMDE